MLFLFIEITLKMGLVVSYKLSKYNTKLMYLKIHLYT